MLSYRIEKEKIEDIDVLKMLSENTLFFSNTDKENLLIEIAKFVLAKGKFTEAETLLFKTFLLACELDEKLFNELLDKAVQLTSPKLDR